MKTAPIQLLCGVLALSATVAANSTEDFLLCTTLFGPVSKATVPTVTYALTLTSHATLKLTSTPSTTVTPPASTETASVTTTITSSLTEPQVTDTFSSTTTTTIVSTTTISSTQTITSTVSTTSTIGTTTTIPTSPGFTPAIAEESVTASVLQRRGLRGRTPKYSTLVTAGKDGKPTAYPKFYPTEVVCAGLVEVIVTTTKVSTATTTTTITAAPPPPSSTTITFTTSTTTTIVPIDASTTITTTDTTSSTSTTSTTTTTTTQTTTTVTLTIPTATFYAACDPSTNQLEYVGGVPIIGKWAKSLDLSPSFEPVYPLVPFSRPVKLKLSIRSQTNVMYAGFGTNNALNQVTSDSAYDCCVACITSSSCGADAFFSPNVCFLVSDDGDCDPKQQVLDFITESGAPGGDFVSSGNCGAIAASPEN